MNKAGTKKKSSTTKDKPKVVVKQSTKTKVSINDTDDESQQELVKKISSTSKKFSKGNTKESSKVKSSTSKSKVKKTKKDESNENDSITSGKKSKGKTNGEEKLYKIKQEGLENYRITKSGKIWNTTTKKFIGTKSVNGYYRIVCSAGTFAIHRLVALTFVKNPDPENKINVDHIDGNPKNNNASNLEWVTQKENTERHKKQISHPKKVKKIDPKTGKAVKIFDQITHAAEDVGVTRRAIQLVLNGKNKTAGGFSWKYVDKNNYAKEPEEFDEDAIANGDAKKVYDYDNYYVHKNGNIYNAVNKRPLKPIKNKAGRFYVTLSRGRKKNNVYVLRIVADHFLPNKPHDQATVEQIDKTDPTNFNVENLKWTNSKQKTIVVRKVLANEEPENPDENNENEEIEKEDIEI
jgi:hypothetical protein